MSAKSFTTAAVAVLLVLVSGQALQVRAQNERWSIFCTDPIGSSAQEGTRQIHPPFPYVMKDKKRC